VRLAVSDQRLVGEGEGEVRVRRAVLDRAGTMPGRGAYLCREGTSGGPSVECVALAARRRALARALRCQISDESAINPELVESISR